MYYVTMHPQVLEVIEEEAGITIYPDYSGRFMSGRKCFGFVADDVISALVRITRRLTEASEVVDGTGEYDAFLDVLDAMSEGGCTDNMGKQSIVYWPHLSVPEEFLCNQEGEE